MPRFLHNGSTDAPITVVLAHGAGAPMDSPFLETMARGLVARGFAVARFEFPYMAARRAGRRPGPDRPDVLRAAWLDAIAELRGAGSGAASNRLVIGGKSLGGRIASLVADQVAAAGLLCLGYPFHPPGSPERLRTAHLATLRTPALIVQGERDPFGTRADVAGYELSPAIEIAWIPDGDHSFKPRKSSGRTEGENLELALERAAAFLGRLEH